ncbi:MAG TPA: hypothetical protein VK447_09315 [Myxococcaceae bacterium]|nr:hypothetical protein [Myxococcaceae bacterium]
MKTWIFAGALAVLGLGGAAFAAEQNATVRDDRGPLNQPSATAPASSLPERVHSDWVGTPHGSDPMPADIHADDRTPPITTPGLRDPSMIPGEGGLGGAGTAGTAPGTGDTGALPPASNPVTQSPAGGAGDLQDEHDRGFIPDRDRGLGTAGENRGLMTPARDDDGYRVRRSPNTGLSVLGGAGVERFAGDVGATVGTGVTWGVTVLAQPNRVLGLELGYSGAVNGVRDTALAGGMDGGADVMRHGGSIAASLGAPWRIQPYVMGGFGVNHFTARGDDASVLGLRSDTAAAIPLGGGIRTNLGPIAADLRLDYNIGLGEGFASGLVGANDQNANRYRGVLQVGGRF